MDQLLLRPRKPVEDDVENWDDDDLDIGGDDFTFRSASAATTATVVLTRRESVSSRLSIRSDFNEERQVHLPEDDERATNDAIATAKKAGIPLPENVPSSALLGGTIKRLGGRKLRKVISDDWDDGDIQVPLGEALKIKRQDGSKFPETLRQVSGPGSLSPQKTLMAAPVFHINHRPELKTKTASSNMLDRYRDDEDDDFLADGEATIKVSKKRNAMSIIPAVTSPTPEKRTETEEDFEQDLQLPSDGALKLTTRKDIPKTPQSIQDDFDDWGEGSLGTRFGGTKRDGRSNRNSDSFAMSPSIASSMTAESEDEGLEGLVLPSGPLNFDDILKKRQQNDWPERQVEVKQPRRSLGGKDDFLTGLEIGDGDVFDSKKLTLNRNIKVKATKQQSPSRPKPSVSLTFTNKPAPPATSRLPRPLGHERIPSSLEPVSESGGPIPSRNRRSQSRMGHSTHSSINSIGISNAASANHPMPPSTPRRRELGSKSSASNLRNEPTTTSSQLLKLKRSMPTMKTYQPSPAKPMPIRYERPPSQTESSNRPLSMSRSKDPIERDRSGAESSMSFVRKNPLPFLPAGGPVSQSHHVAAKSSRHLRRNDSESSSNSADFRPPSRTFSRQTMRSPSPRRTLRGADMLAREATLKRQITKPIRRRHFGDGCELDAFDDLPTSRDVEQKFVKEPIGRGPPRQLTLRNKAHQHIMPTRNASPVPLTPLTPAKSRSELPRFARDTAASRMAREATSSNRSVSGSGAPLAALTNQWRAKVAATTGLSPVHAQGSVRSKKHKVPQKPQLIKPLGNVNNPRSVKGMKYDPVNYRWEGNEIEVSAFDMPASATSTASIPVQTPRAAPPQIYREKECSTPRPALITNINSAQNVQVVGGMVFDPQRMCWLKMPGDNKRTKSDSGDTMDGFDALDDEEEDVFRDVPDLEDGPSKESDEISGSKGEGASGLSDWLVGEEFDVGPEFVKRQREEEERWRRKCEKWTGNARDTEGNSWRWSIRDVVNEL